VNLCETEKLRLNKTINIISHLPLNQFTTRHLLRIRLGHCCNAWKFHRNVRENGCAMWIKVFTCQKRLRKKCIIHISASAEPMHNATLATDTSWQYLRFLKVLSKFARKWMCNVNKSIYLPKTFTKKCDMHISPSAKPIHNATLATDKSWQYLWFLKDLSKCARKWMCNVNKSI
jgi:hypothetical protein